MHNFTRFEQFRDEGELEASRECETLRDAAIAKFDDYQATQRLDCLHVTPRRGLLIKSLSKLVHRV
jgi:hypothetical protein